MNRVKPIKIEDFVIEWAVEDVEKYEAVAKANVGQNKQRGITARGTEGDITVSNTIITVVLEVPRPMTEHVTSLLRSSNNLKFAAYLQTCSEHAFDAAAKADALIKQQMVVDALSELTLSYAKRLGVADAEVKAALEQIKKATPAVAEAAVKSMREALKEKRTEVAARMLQAMPDEE